MEPFLDPAVEAKVTGQEGTVVAKRFVYRYSTESNIVELHKQIEAGQVSLDKRWIVSTSRSNSDSHKGNASIQYQ